MKKVMMFLAVIIVIGTAPCVMAQSRSAGDGADLEQRIRQLEESVAHQDTSSKWSERVRISGVIEAEAGFGKTDYDDPAQADEKTSDADLASAELAVDVAIADHLEGHVMFKYEDDDLFMDDGYILVTGTEAFPAYLKAGRMYLPFGYFDSHFISDPVTLVLGETSEGALVAGYRMAGDLLDISVGAFNGKARETGEDDAIDSYVAALNLIPVKGLMLGASFISNLAGTDGLNAEVNVPDELDALVAGWSAYITFEFLDRFKLIGEYVGALDSFEAGELYDGDALERRPTAWNAEFGVALMENLELAVRYGGSDDGGAFLPETEYGAVLNWGLRDNTNLALEYLHGGFEDDLLETDAVIAQLAVEF